MSGYALIIAPASPSVLTPLPAAEHDARALATVVAQLTLDMLDRRIAPERLTMLLGAEATPAAVVAALAVPPADAPPPIALTYLASYATLDQAGAPWLLLAGVRAALPAIGLLRALRAVADGPALAWLDLCAIRPAQAVPLADALIAAAEQAEVAAIVACASDPASRTLPAGGGRLAAALSASLTDERLLTTYHGRLTAERLVQAVASALATQPGGGSVLRATPGGASITLRRINPPPHQYFLVGTYNDRGRVHCTFCGRRASFDNLYLCSECGALFCVGCISQRPKLEQGIFTGVYRCDCGGEIR